MLQKPTVLNEKNQFKASNMKTPDTRTSIDYFTGICRFISFLRFVICSEFFSFLRKFTFIPYFVFVLIVVSQNMDLPLDNCKSPWDKWETNQL